MLQINGFTFAGAPLTIQRYGGAAAAGEPTTADTKAKMTAFLSKRYYQQTKLLDLSNLANDPDLVEMGMFNSISTQSKFFPALMKVWEMNIKDAKARREAV
jgi:nuclear RNA export factor